MLLKSLSSLASPLSESQVTKLTQLTSELSTVQLAWVSGYLAASAEQHPVAGNVSVQQETVSNQKLTILYGSQTGNGRSIATELADKARAQGYGVNLQSMGEYKVRQLKQETLLLLVVSTHGEGDAPDDAIELHKFLDSKRAPDLDKLHYSVLALGDSSYEFFCQTGKDFDLRLKAKGAKALLPVMECDVDYEAAAEQWQSTVLEKVKPFIQESGDNVVAIEGATAGRETRVDAFNKHHPYAAELLLNQKITGRESDRTVIHVELDLAESGLSYKPGDALGVWFTNDPAVVDEVIDGLALDSDEILAVGKEVLPLRQALLEKKELTQLYPGLVKEWAQLSGHSQLQAICEDKEQIRQFILSHQVADLVTNYPIEDTAKVSGETLLGLLRPLTPRLYSIASSQSEVESEVHLTVALEQEQHQGTPRFGGASQFLVQAQEGQQVRVYVEPNEHFRLPQNSETPVIMIGPGTGVAPFRAFIQERAAQEASGNTWLFFGNPHFEQDFLYQTEWQNHLQQGELSRIDLAFSRDQEHKVYVQHKIAEQGQELWQWLQAGAYLYICGDAQRMAKDVHQALLEVGMRFGDMSEEQAQDYFETLRVNKRYQKDVY